MIDFSRFAQFKEIAIMFSNEYKECVQTIYDECQSVYPDKSVFLVHSSGVLCPLKCDKYESYIVVGIGCPLHPFPNAEYYQEELDSAALECIASHSGAVVFDSIYRKYAAVKELAPTDNSNEPANSIAHDQKGKTDLSAPMLVVTYNQDILDFYNYNYENVKKLPNTLVMKDRMRYLMKENINGSKIHEKNLWGIVFTSTAFEGIATALHRRLNEHARAYKIFLKDISYERLISIDNLEGIVLIDCPVFQCNIRLHIPVISPFSVECGLNKNWSSDYNRNHVDLSECKELTIQSFATDLMCLREYKGVLYRGTEQDDMKIHKGGCGTAAQYDYEQDYAE